jgi:hypothetical protein
MPLQADMGFEMRPSTNRLPIGFSLPPFHAVVMLA